MAVAIASVAGVAAGLVVVAALLLDAGPRFGWYQPVTVLSGSMAPTIPTGAVVIDRPVRLDTIRPGDIITYRIPVGDRHVITHRVVEVLVPGPHPVVRTKGDASTTPDPWTAHLVSGPVWRSGMVIPGLGYALVALRQPPVRTGLALLIPASLALMALRAIWRSQRDQRDQRGQRGQRGQRERRLPLPVRLSAPALAGGWAAPSTRLHTRGAHRRGHVRTDRAGLPRLI